MTGGKPTAWLDEIDDHSSDYDLSPGQLIIDTMGAQTKRGKKGLPVAHHLPATVSCIQLTHDETYVKREVVNRQHGWMRLMITAVMTISLQVS